jgi:hypothetical protein
MKTGLNASEIKDLMETLYGIYDKLRELTCKLEYSQEYRELDYVASVIFSEYTRLANRQVDEE